MATDREDGPVHISVLADAAMSRIVQRREERQRNSLRNQTATKLGAALSALTFAEHRLRQGAGQWPDADADMTPHEIEEACARIAGIKARVSAELVQLTKPAPVEASA